MYFGYPIRKKSSISPTCLCLDCIGELDWVSMTSPIENILLLAQTKWSQCSCSFFELRMLPSMLEPNVIKKQCLLCVGLNRCFYDHKLGLSRTYLERVWLGGGGGLLSAVLINSQWFRITWLQLTENKFHTLRFDTIDRLLLFLTIG